MEQKNKSVFADTAAKIPIKVLDVVIILGIAAMALLIPFLSARGGFTVNFDSLGGSSVPSQKLRYGESITEPPSPVRENYVFDGWCYDPDGKQKVDFDSSTASASITLYASWVEG